MKNRRLGAIFCEINNPPQNYATTILESLATLDTTRNIFLNQNNPYMNQALITNEFRNILNNVYSSENPISAMNLINYLNKNVVNSDKDLNKCNNPYFFLIFLLSKLEEEYNNAFQINNNLNQEFPSIENAAYFFKSIYESNNISIISKNYCFSMVRTLFCNSCKTTKSKPTFKNTITLKIDLLKQKFGSGSLSLNDCLNHYFTPKQNESNCQYCDNSKPFEARVILKSGPVLIIYLYSENNTGLKDPNFTINYNLDLSPYKKDKNDGNNNYRLKSCLSFSNYGFFTDCFINRGNSNGEWFRYMDKEVIVNRQSLFEFQPILLFYESIDNQNDNNINNMNINNMNININQNMNYNGQINQSNLNMNQINNNFNAQNNQNIIINENNNKIFDVISNFPLINNMAFGEQLSNFDFNFGINSNIINNPQSNLQMNSNFNNYQNQNNNNNFGNISSQSQNQFNQINQNNINNMDNNNINNQNINNNNFEINLNELYHYDDEDEKGETDIQNIKNDNNQNNENNEISNNPFFNAVQNSLNAQNSNFQNNNFNMNISMQNNLNQNINQNENINNNINQNLNQNEIPNLDNFNSNQNNNNNMAQNNSSNENQNDFSEQNLQNNMSNNNLNNEMKNDIQQNLNMIINNEQNNQMEPNFQQNDFMSNNNILSNDISNSINSQEEKIEIPQMSLLNFPQEKMKIDINNQINDSPQFIPNSNIEIQNTNNNEIPQNMMNPMNMNINSNQNNFNPIPQINIPQVKVPQNISNEINKIKIEESNQINKEIQKPINKLEPKKIEKKIELNKPQESQPKIKNNIQDKAKLFSGGLKLNNPQENAVPKKKLNKDIFPKNEPKKQESKPMNFGGNKPNKFKDFKALLEKKGMIGAPRPSAQMMGMPHGFAGMMIHKNDKSGQGPTFEENKDLVKKFDVIKVQKKKKKAKINFDDEN